MRNVIVLKKIDKTRTSRTLFFRSLHRSHLTVSSEVRVFGELKELKRILSRARSNLIAVAIDCRQLQIFEIAELIVNWVAVFLPRMPLVHSEVLPVAAEGDASKGVPRRRRTWRRLLQKTNSLPREKDRRRIG